MSKNIKLLPILIVLAICGFILIATVILSDHSRQVAPITKCSEGLARLGTAALIYANDHNDILPLRIADMASDTEGNDSFTCPISGEAYLFLGDVTLDMPPYAIMAYCPTRHYRSGLRAAGTIDDTRLNVLELGGHVRSIRGRIDANMIPYDFHVEETIPGVELKAKYFYSLPDGVDRLQVCSHHGHPNPPPVQVYFDYTSPTLYTELDEILEFQSKIRSESSQSVGGWPPVIIFFYRGDERCALNWPYWPTEDGRFFLAGLLTEESRRNLHSWFEIKGFTKFREWQDQLK